LICDFRAPGGNSSGAKIKMKLRSAKNSIKIGNI